MIKAGWKIQVPVGLAAVGAVAASIKCAVDTKQGRSIRKEAAKRFKDAVSQCEAARLKTEAAVLEYGDYQIRAHKGTVGRLADWLERNEQLVRRLSFEKVDGVRVHVPDIPKYVASVENVTAGVVSLVSAVGAGVAARAAALWGVSTFASAGTGTAISSLSGAAARSAALAWLGGGPLTAGGGGVSAGRKVLGFVPFVSALLVGGMTMGVVGARTKAEAREFAATVEVRIARVGLVMDMLGAVEDRIGELGGLLGRLAYRAGDALDKLEAVDFDPDLHAREFVHALQLVTAVKEVLSTPVLEPESGELTEASVEILRKYV